MTPTDDLLGAFELHSVEGIERALEAGADVSAPIRDKQPIEWLIEMYTRSSRFADCVRAMLDAGARIEDTLLRALLLDDEDLLGDVLAARGADVERRFQLACAYTSLHGVSALHVCSEYNSLGCAKLLLDRGVDVDVRADVDGDGLGGQTPIFHAVNSNRNHCRPMMELLTTAGADLDLRVHGLVWGRDCEWETVVFDVTPIAYAQCGLYPQFHRQEEQVYANIDFLHRRRYGRAAPRRNVPNPYVRSDFDLAAARRGQRPDPS